jgi:competence protein ComEA
MKKRDKSAGFLILVLVILLFHVSGTGFDHKLRNGHPASETPVFIQIAGDIKTPGVYSFSHQPDLHEIIDRAGGSRRLDSGFGASGEVVFSSGQRLIVRQDGKGNSVFQGEMSAFFKLTLGIPISLNGESEVGLTALPGIGPGLARAIVRERTKRGGFRNLDEIMVVRGIGRVLFGRIRPYLTL